MRSVAAASVLEKADDVILFDTRSPALIERDGLPGAQSLSLEALQAGALPDLPKDTRIYIVCEHGQISELAALYLETAGFSDVHNVAGGMRACRELLAMQTKGSARTL